MFSKIKREFVRFYFLKVKRDYISYARYLGVTVGEKCQILPDPSRTFGTEPWLIKLGNHVDITAGVQFLNHEGALWCLRGIDSVYEKYDCFLPITVGDNVLIGVNSLIMPGVHIGNNVIIAAHSVVTKDIPDNTVVAGLPAKSIASFDKTMEKLRMRELVPTKQMSQEQKRQYLMKIHPEWFD